jgi:phosphoribosylformimino-5-aminoimidazole carboxamide ribotide isomerase
MEVQVAGGIQTDEQIERLLNDGAHRIVLGTRAIHDPDWLSEMADQFPGSLLVAADVRDRHVVTHGWSSISDRYILDLIEDLNDVALAGVLVTSVARAGSMLGADVALIEEIVEIATHPVCARGGIGTLGDLRALEDRGAASVVIGMALYTGALTPEMIAAEFAE